MMYCSYGTALKLIQHGQLPLFAAPYDSIV